MAEVQRWEYDEGKILAWSEYGDPSGAPVFFHHGWPGSGSQARLADRLASERGLRIITFDRPGMGESTFVKDRHIDEMAGLVGKLADHLSIERFGQLAVSGGGPYVVAVAAALPERVVASAVLSGMVSLPLVTDSLMALNIAYRSLAALRHLPAFFFKPFFGILSWICSFDPRRFPLSLIFALAPADERACLQDPELWEVVSESIRSGLKGSAKGTKADAEIYMQKPDFDPMQFSGQIQFWHSDYDFLILPILVQEFTEQTPSTDLVLDSDYGHISLAIRRAPDALDYLCRHLLPGKNFSF